MKLSRNKIKNILGNGKHQSQRKNNFVKGKKKKRGLSKNKSRCINLRTKTLKCKKYHRNNNIYKGGNNDRTAQETQSPSVAIPPAPLPSSDDSKKLQIIIV